MKRLTFINPYSDDSLQYDEKADQYYLTREYCKNAFDHTFKSDLILDRRIVKNSDKVYNFIYSRVNSNNAQIVAKILSSTKEGREFMLKLLTYQMEADIDSAFNDLTSVPAVNVSNGQIIPREELVRNQVTVDVEQLLINNSRYLGINIWYAAKFPPQYLFYLKV